MQVTEAGDRWQAEPKTIEKVEGGISESLYSLGWIMLDSKSQQLMVVLQGTTPTTTGLGAQGVTAESCWGCGD